MSLNALTLLTRLTTKAKLRHMQALLALIELRSMGRAAQALGMTQPAMSQLVSELERLMEAQLFLRHSRGIDPTPTAMDLLPIARRIIAAAEEGAERIAARQMRDSGLVRCATTAASTGILLDRALPEFAQQHPAVQVQLNTVVGATLDAAFSSDQYDVVCCRDRTVVPDGWSFTACEPDSLIVVCGETHPLAHRSDVSMEELGRAVWLQNHVSTIARHKFDELAAAQGWSDIQEVRILSRVGGLIWSMLRNGTCVALVPKSVVAPWLDYGLIYEIPTELGLTLLPIGFFWRPDHAGSATRHFAKALTGTGSLSRSKD